MPQVNEFSWLYKFFNLNLFLLFLIFSLNYLGPHSAFLENNNSYKIKFFFLL